MTEMAPEAHVPDQITKTARNLTEIERLVADLAEQAIHDANDRELPGGDALAALAPVASPEAWEHRFEANEALGRDTSHVAEENDDDAPPLQTLLYWSEQWRTEHGWPLDSRPTIASEVNFLRWCLNWAWDNEPRFDDMARDVSTARRRLEDILHAGNRAERSRVVCNACDAAPRLVKVYACPDDRLPAPDDVHWWHLVDHHKCPACRARFDGDAFQRAHAAQLRSRGAERFVPWPDALGTLRAQGRAERTVRKWLLEGDVESFCHRESRVLYVWWPDLWRLHLVTDTRRRGAA